MKTSTLQSFLRVVEFGSFSKAAESLSLSQPAVTQHIKQLEDAYGIRLFIRSRQQLQLTREGKVLLTYARRITALEQAMAQEIRTGGRQISSLTVGITHTAESNMTITAIAAFTHSLKNTNLKIYTNSTRELISLVQNYELDFAIVDQVINSPQLQYTQLDSDSLVLVLPPEHPLAELEQVDLQAIKQEPLILRLPQANTRNMFVAALDAINISIQDFNVFMEIDSIDTIKDLIRRNFGLSVLAKSACVDEWRRNKLKLLPIQELKTERLRHIVCRQNYDHPEIIHMLVDTYHKLMNP